MLASIQTITEIKEHPNADRLEIAKVLGWNVVVKKGDFKQGERCIYIALDSIVPAIPAFEFLANKDYRVRTIKLRGIVSQGLCVGTDLIDGQVNSYSLPIGQDVTDLLGVKKYEKPAPICQDAAGSFPTHLANKTDEERLQNDPVLFDLLTDCGDIYISTKHDGTSATFIKHDDRLIVCSRNLEIKDGNNTYWNIARKYNLQDLPNNYVVQGEIVGPGIQKNHEGLKEIELRVFNVFHKGVEFSFAELVTFCNRYKLPMVEVIYSGPMNPGWKSYEDLVEYANTAIYRNNQAMAEGMVFRPVVPAYCLSLGKNLSFKVISNNYGLKYGE